MKKHINWRLFFILLGLSLISVACVFPYVLTVQKEVIEKIGKPVWLLFLAQFIQSAILFSVAIFFGLFFAKKTGFRFPLMEAILEKRDYHEILKSTLKKSASIGVAVAVIIYITDILFTLKGAAISTHQSYAPVWQKLLAAVYGGMTEEIMTRLFLMTFFVWLGMKLFKKDQPTKLNIVISILLAAIIFGLGHLPITASLTKLDFIVVARAVVLNGIAGVVFGWLYWKKGLESAMIAHFTADIFLLTLLPLLFQ